MVADLARFNRGTTRLLRTPGDNPSLGEWLDRHRFSRAFVERLIVPQVAAVWSADPRQRWSFPFRFLAEFFDHHGMLSFTRRPQWRVVRGGSARYVEALVRPLADRLRLNTPVRAVTRRPDHVLVEAAGREPERFDEVVIATHSDQALGMLTDATDAERKILGAIPYQLNEAVLHTDERMLPRRRPAWASWNYHLVSEPSDRATVTYHMNRLQSLRSEREFCVTLNRTDAIDPASVIRTIPYAHPVFTQAGVEAQARRAEISGHNRTSFAGAYWGWGFHEDGVVSAVRVAERLGGTL
jgi:predicted NAD/FAD-binding protein